MSTQWERSFTNWGVQSFIRRIGGGLRVSPQIFSVIARPFEGRPWQSHRTLCTYKHEGIASLSFTILRR